MATITIHYQSPAHDPYKVPRPHRYQLTGDRLTDRSPACKGGEIGQVRLLGFCPTPTPDVDNWALVTPDDVGDPGYVATELAGFFAQFVDMEDGGMFGYDVPIERVDIEV